MILSKLIISIPDISIICYSMVICTITAAYDFAGTKILLGMIVKFCIYGHYENGGMYISNALRYVQLKSDIKFLIFFSLCNKIRLSRTYNFICILHIEKYLFHNSRGLGHISDELFFKIGKNLKGGRNANFGNIDLPKRQKLLLLL